MDVCPYTCVFGNECVCERVRFRDFETKGVDLSSPGGTLLKWEGNGNEGFPYAFPELSIGSTVGVTRVQKAHVPELYVHERWKPVGLSDVYWNYKMIEQVNGHWEFNLRDHAFAFPEI